ncbi:Homeodomain-interacting protein kinase 3 [Takifugu flavidus]|uniref:Homeodomain-interacting protein kinase 3 n=1 Tax=Takifugu flavidus TaxID=433684 RepID=A0A5C6PLY9_9TELE|nr:Homeodomain-interacting protein kinase 3 [Takifugu flavidus]
MREVTTLNKLQKLDVDKCNIVRFYTTFTDRGFNCLVFEHLDRSLYGFVKQRPFHHLLLKAISMIVQQLAAPLETLKSIGVMHCDISLPNVMLVNHEKEPFRVKLIDFGLAHEVSYVPQGSTIQKCNYRAPEVMLGLPLTEAIDMWSLGCLAVRLYLGVRLFPLLLPQHALLASAHLHPLVIHQCQNLHARSVVPSVVPETAHAGDTSLFLLHREVQSALLMSQLLQQGNSVNLLNCHIYLLEGLSPWNQDRAAAVTAEPSTLNQLPCVRAHCVNSNYEKVFGSKPFPGFSPPANYTGELIGVQYLLRQNNEPLQDMHPNSEETSQLLEELDVEEPKDADEGYFFILFFWGRWEATLADLMVSDPITEIQEAGQQ